MSLGTAMVAPEKAVFRPALPLLQQPEFTGERDMAHGAIETIYKGYRFRSRLEARWAVFFDSAGIEWQYEVQGYEVDGYRYLPDFYLPKDECWVEVKGDPTGLHKDIPRLRAMLGDSSPLPGMKEETSLIIVLGEVPDPGISVPLHPCFCRDDGQPLRTWAFFCRTKEGAGRAGVIEPSMLMPLMGLRYWRSPEENSPADAWSPKPILLRAEIGWPKVAEAYRKARQARFEHGEEGVPRA